MIKEQKRDANDIFGMPILGFIFKNSLFVSGVRFLVFLLFAYAIFLGFVDNSPENSFTEELFLGLFWPFFMVLSLPLIGRAFCGICPHNFIGKYLTKMGVKRDVPAWLQSRYIGLAIIILGWWAVYYAAPSLYKTPIALATFFLFLTIIAVIFFFLYKEMAYCKYICPIGTLSRGFSKLSPTWLSTYKSACGECKTFDCANACEANLKPFTFDTKNSMGDCTLCMDCADACEGVKFSFTRPSSALFKNFKFEKAEVWAFILITAAISITMTFHHALGRTAIVKDFIWSRSAAWFSQNIIDLPSVDIVGVFAFIYAMILTVGVVMIGMFIASKILDEKYEKTFYTLGYAFAPIFIIGGLSHLLEAFFTHNYSAIANGLIYGLHLPFEPVSNLAQRGDGWLRIFGFFPYIAAIWAYVIMAKRMKFFEASKLKRIVAFFFASALITLFLGLNFYKIYVYKTYGFAKMQHHASSMQLKVLKGASSPA